MAKKARAGSSTRTVRRRASASGAGTRFRNGRERFGDLDRRSSNTVRRDMDAGLVRSAARFDLRAIGIRCPDIAGRTHRDNPTRRAWWRMNAKTGEMKWYYSSRRTTHTTGIRAADAASSTTCGRGNRASSCMHGECATACSYVLDRTSGGSASHRELSTKVTGTRDVHRDGKADCRPGSIATKEWIAACPAGAAVVRTSRRSRTTRRQAVLARASAIAAASTPRTPIRWRHR